MPSRRDVVHAVVLCSTMMGGCSRTGADRTRTPRTETTRSTTTSYPTTESTPTDTETPTETDVEPECDWEWEPDLSWEYGDEGDVNAAIPERETIYALYSRSVAAIDPTTGTEIWKTSIDGIGRPGARRSSFQTAGRIIASGSRGVAAIKPETGDVDWSYTIPGKKATAHVQDAVAYDGVVYISAVNDDTPEHEAEDPYSRVYSIDVATGEHQLFADLPLDEYVRNPRYLLADDDGVYLVYGDRLLSFDFDGQENWRSDVSWASAPALEDGTLIVPSDESLVAYETTTGKELWTNELARRAVTIEDRIAYAPVQRGNQDGIAALDVTDGTLLWETATLGAGDQPSVRDGVVYLRVNDTNHTDYLVTFDTRWGCELGYLKFEPDAVHAFEVGADHVFPIQGVSHGDLYAYTVPDVES